MSTSNIEKQVNQWPLINSLYGRESGIELEIMLQNSQQVFPAYERIVGAEIKPVNVLEIGPSANPFPVFPHTTVTWVEPDIEAATWLETSYQAPHHVLGVPLRYAMPTLARHKEPFQVLIASQVVNYLLDYRVQLQQTMQYCMGQMFLFVFNSHFIVDPTAQWPYSPNRPTCPEDVLALLDPYKKIRLEVLRENETCLSFLALLEKK